MIYDIIKKAQNLQNLLCVYTNKEDTSTFSLGYIQKVTNNDILINSISTRGRYDGYIVKKIKDIFLIEENNKYIHKVIDVSNKDYSHKKISNKYKNLFKSILCFSKTENLVVSVQLNYSGLTDIQGYVDDIDDHDVSFFCIDNYGLNDGKAICSINDITILSCDGEDEMSLKLLSSTSID